MATTALDVAAMRAGLGRVADRMLDRRDELNAADAALGDGDLGVAAAEGFAGVRAELDRLSDDLGAALLACAQALVRVRASSFATIVATGLMAAAAVVRGETSVPWARVAAMLEAAIAKMSARGRSSLGEKTVLDSLEAVRVAVVGIEDPDRLRERAAAAARGVLDEFRGRPCRQGRARIFAEKSVGLDDPGMLAVRHMVEALAAAGD
jgi:phosphoenolpyruvate---glycerone phosphotransferase subunit DhaL